MRVWDALYFKPGEFKPDPQQVGRLESRRLSGRGARALRRLPHAEDRFSAATRAANICAARYLQGWFAPDITNDERVGLGHWSSDDIVAYLKTGHNRITAATGPMAEEIEHSTSKHEGRGSGGDRDLSEIAAGSADSPAPLQADDPVMVAGQAHLPRPMLGLPSDSTAKACRNCSRRSRNCPVCARDDPTTLIRIVLRGARSVATEQEPTAPGMPSFGWQLDDEQIAAVVTYVRNAWGRPAAAVAPDDVSKMRDALSMRAD